MKINQLKLRNFRLYPELEISFLPGMNMIAGINGSGKSTVLDAIGLMLSQLVARLRSESGRGAAISNADIRIGEDSSGIELVFEDSGHQVHVGLAGTRTGFEKVAESNFKELAVWAKEYREKRSAHEKVNYPLFAHYRVNRAVLDIPQRQKDVPLDDPLNGYDGALSGGSNFRQFFAWFRDYEDYEQQVKSRSDSQYCDPDLEAVRQALGKALPGIKEIHVKRRPQAMWATKAGVPIEVSQLSDGEKCYLALVGDIASRLSRLNVGMKKSSGDILASSGVVLVDELDLHLHPQWQRMVVRLLPRIFPNIQFIVSTHSPQMIGEVMAERVHFLFPDRATPFSPANTLGLTSSEILKLNMGTEERNVKIGELEMEIRKALDDDNFKAAEAGLEKIRGLITHYELLPLYNELLTELEFLR